MVTANQFITSLTLSTASCLVSIAGISVSGIGGAVSDNLPIADTTNKYELRHRDISKEIFRRFKKLQRDVHHLVNSMDESPYTPNQKRKMQILLKKIGQLGHELEKLEKRNSSYLKEIKKAKRNRSSK